MIDKAIYVKLFLEKMNINYWQWQKIKIYLPVN